MFTTVLIEERGKCIEDKATYKINGAVILSQEGEFYSKGVDCQVTLEAESHERIMLRFEKFDLPNTHLATCLDAVYMFDGRSPFKNPIVSANRSLII